MNGGWGIKNLHWFSVAVRLKKLWMVLHSNGLWHNVLLDKYLKKLSVVAWLIGKNFNYHGISIIWKDFMQTLPWLGRFLSWHIGSGHDVLVGIDPIVGT